MGAVLNSPLKYRPQINISSIISISLHSFTLIYSTLTQKFQDNNALHRYNPIKIENHKIDHHLLQHLYQISSSIQTLNMFFKLPLTTLLTTLLLALNTNATCYQKEGKCLINCANDPMVGCLEKSVNIGAEGGRAVLQVQWCCVKG